MHHSTDQREVITRTDIGKKLKKDAVRDLVWLLVAAVFAAQYVWLIFFEPEMFRGRHLIVYIMAGAAAALVIWGGISMVYNHVRLVYALFAGKYTVTEDTFCQFELRDVPWYQSSRHHVNDYVFSFASGKTYKVSNLEYNRTRLGYAAQFSKEGEKFYLVSADYKPDKVLLIYSGTLYRYEDR
jgi:hypothetical protein